MREETQLLRDALAGDAGAFEAIVQKYQSLVCAITFSGTGRVDISEELAQETFLRAWQNLHQLRDTGGFRAWLCTIARNLLHSYYRKNRPEVLASGEFPEMADGVEGPSEALVRQEEQAVLERAIKSLPAEYREPLVLYYRQEKSVRQVAQSLGLKESAVQTRLHRARQMLREEIAGRLERTLERTAPGKAFTRSVMVAIGATVAGGVASASAAGAGATTGAAAPVGTLAVKLAAAAAVLAVAAGAFFVYQSDRGEAAVVVPEVKVVVPEEPEVILPEKPQGTEPVEEPAVAAATEEIEPTPPVILETVKPKTAAKVVKSDTALPVAPSFVPRGVLSGLVTDARTGEPVTDAEVTISPGLLLRAKTDPNGFYSFDSIEKDGDYSIGVYSNAYLGFTDSSSQPKLYLKKEDQVVKHFELERACVIDLYVIDEEERPLKGANVWASSLSDDYGRKIGRSYVSQRTNQDGYIQLGGFAPSEVPYVITALHTTEGGWVEKYGQKYREPVPDFAPGHLRVTLTDPNIVEYGEIVLHKGVEVKGVATYIDGTPAKECRIAPYPEWWHSTTCPPDFAIDPNGFFTLSQIIPGTYRVQASVPTGRGASLGMALVTTQLPLEKGELLELVVPQRPSMEDDSSAEASAATKL